MTSTIQPQTHQTTWIGCSHPRTQPALRLFCFPYAGGGASIYRDWSTELPESVEVCTVQLPGRENRVLEEAFDDLNLLGQILLPILRPWLDLPFAFFGHSMGTLMVYEVARLLKLHWDLEPAHLIVSGRYAPHWHDGESPIHQLPDAELLQAIQNRYGGIPKLVWQDDELMNLIAPTLRADFTLVEQYVPLRTPQLTTPITAFAGISDRLTNHDNLYAWQELTDGPFELHMFEGEHFFIQETTSEVLADLSKILQGSLQAIVCD